MWLLVYNARAHEMKRRVTSATAAIALILAAGGSKIVACTWAIGYFYQVTNLRGTVVGSHFPVLNSLRWYRQSVVRSQAKLTLYGYCWPCDVLNRAPVKAVVTDATGKFDFGSLKPSHYYLRIDDEKGALSALFQVEVKSPQNSRESETIDVSPVYPDCTGGHEFIVRAN
jgi:hypothetical protein